MRLRTTAASNDDDGQPSLSTPAGTASAALTHLVYSRSANGTAVIYLNGVPVTSGTIPGTFANWDDSYRLGLANEVDQDRGWLGTFYEVGLYDCAFTAADVAASQADGLNETTQE